MKPLPSRDAAEIYYALCSKIVFIQRGFYNPEDEESPNKDWVKHLEQIKKKIGVDGKNLTR